MRACRRWRRRECILCLHAAVGRRKKESLLFCAIPMAASSPSSTVSHQLYDKSSSFSKRVSWKLSVRVSRPEIATASTLGTTSKTADGGLSASEMSSPGDLLTGKSAKSTPPYPGGMGPYTGRDPTVKKPAWLRQKAPQGERFAELKESLSTLKLNTVCEEAQCPNIGEVCFATNSFAMQQ